MSASPRPSANPVRPSASVDVPSASVVPSALPTFPAACRSDFPAIPNVNHAFMVTATPAGTDACYEVGPYGDPQPLALTNDGPIVAFSARDFAHERDLWLGDLRDASVKVAYVAPEPKGKKVEVWSPQLAKGELYWLEYTHNGIDISYPTASWVVRRMNVGTGKVETVGHDNMPNFGGKKYVERLRWDGSRLAVLVVLPNRTWRIETWDEQGRLLADLPVTGTPYDMALVGDGILFTAGTPYPPNDAIGKMRTYLWHPGGTAAEIGADAFSVAGCDGLGGWISDPTASQESTGRPVLQRVYGTMRPYTSSIPLSPEPVETGGTSGADAIACGSNTLAWLEADGPAGLTDVDALTLWQPQWSAPQQISTAGRPDRFALNGGWLVWFEYTAQSERGRLRGVPLSLIPNWQA
jgi:hypothetical protein